MMSAKIKSGKNAYSRKEKKKNVLRPRGQKRNTVDLEDWKLCVAGMEGPAARR